MHEQEPTALGSWRESVLRRMLTVAAVVAPAVIVLALFVRSAPRSWLDVAVLATTGALLPILRLARGLSVRARAAAVLGALFLTASYYLARVGFAAGVSVALTATCVLGVVYLGRAFGFLLVGLSALAVVTVGLLVTQGVVVLLPGEVDPFHLRNWLRMAGTTSLMAVLLAMVVDFVIRHVEATARATAHALAQLRLAYERLGRLHERLEAAKEEERRFIAHELHDELGQTLTALKLRIQLGARAGGGAVAPGPAVAEALGLIDQLIGRVRKMSGDLRPPLLDEVGLVPALRAYLESQTAACGVAFDLEAEEPDSSRPLPPDLEISCFRIVQEAIANIVRHAAASRVYVRLVRTDARLALSIKDDGRGFDLLALDREAALGPMGVVGMRERVRGRAGTFSMRSSPDVGTTIEIELPVDSAGKSVRGDEAIPTGRAGQESHAGAGSSWRESVQQGMLTVTAIVAPVLVALALFIQPSPRFLIDKVVLGATGLVLPLLWLARRVSISERSPAAIVTLFGAGVYVLARAGFATGVSVVLVTTCVLGVICVGRGFGGTLIVLSLLAHVVVGVFVTQGRLIHDPAEVDPSAMQNWIRLAALISLLAGLMAIVIDFVIRHLEDNARSSTEAFAELRRAYERLGRLHRRVEAAKEEERRFIAHELHDELGQTLTALKLRIQVGARTPSDAIGLATKPDDRAPEPVVLIDQLIGLVRRISVDLRPPLLDEIGLVPALRAYLETQAAVSGIGVALEAEEATAGARFAPDLEISCFRVVQESVTNALRHASARTVRVGIVRVERRLRLSIRDDGQGFDPDVTLDAAAADGHLGVLGMRERVRARDGVFQLTSQRGGGTTVEVDLPIDP